MAEQGIELATAWVRLVFGAEGIQDSITTEVNGAAAEADKAGKKAAGKFSDSWKTGLAAAGVAAGALLAAGAVGAFDSALASGNLEGTMLAALPDAATAQAAASAASSVYADGWGESLAEVGDNAATVARALSGLGDTTPLDHVLEQTTALSSTFGQDVPRLINAAGQAVKTGLAPDIASALDLITVGLQSPANAADDLLDTFNEYGVQFEKLGIDGPAALGLLNQGLAGGARNSDLVADAIKEFSIRAIDGSGTTAAGFAAIGQDAAAMAAQIAAGGPTATAALDATVDSLRAIEDPVARDAAAVALFGTQAEDLGAALFALDPSTAATGIGDISTAAEDATTASAGLDQAWVGVTRTILDGLGTALTPTLTFLSENEPVIWAIAGVLGFLALAFVGVTVATWAMNTALLANPITWIVLLIAGLVGAIIWLATQTTFFQDAWEATMTGIGVAATWVWESVIKPVVDWIVGAWEAASDGVAAAWKLAVGLIKGYFNMIISGWNAVVDGLNWAGDILGPVIGVEFDIPNLPMLADGGTITRSGSVLVGEQGPEILNLPRGASVDPDISHLDGGRGDTWNITTADSAERLAVLIANKLAYRDRRRR